MLDQFVQAANSEPGQPGRWQWGAITVEVKMFGPTVVWARICLGPRFFSLGAPHTQQCRVEMQSDSESVWVRSRAFLQLEGTIHPAANR